MFVAMMLCAVRDVGVMGCGGVGARKWGEKEKVGDERSADDGCNGGAVGDSGS